MIENPPDFLQIQTRSPLVNRDIDLLVKLTEKCDVLVSMTIETDRDNIRKIFTPIAPGIQMRIKALQEVHDAGISTQASISPVLPFTPDFPKILDGIVDHIWIDTLTIGDGAMGNRSERLGMPQLFEEHGLSQWYQKELHVKVEKYFHKYFRTKNGISFKNEITRGLDHGAWVVLRMLYPNADIPVIAMSVKPNLTPNEQYKIGKSLSELREKDILIIASGGTVHNLRALKWADIGEVDRWALEFEEWLAKNLENWDLQTLFHYDSLAPNASLAVPPYGNEHFIPIFYAMGAADNLPKATLLHREFRYGNLSHSVWQFG